MKTIGITTTVPIEVLLAAGYKVIDLNNLFITSENYSDYIDLAERDGFPKSSCAWVKGIYGACLKNNINEIVGVIEGDCSASRAQLEVLRFNGIKVYPFAYPSRHSYNDVKNSIDDFIKLFNLSYEEVETFREKLSEIRNLSRQLDLLSYVDNKATGFENHLFQVMLSDINGDSIACKNLIGSKIEEIKARSVLKQKLRLAYIGVPPMTCDLYDFVESKNARIVYNEVQREFAFPRHDRAKNIYEQYFDYTYPYDLEFRISEIKKQVEDRKIDGIIHYTQAFCHRAIEDIVIKKHFDIPVLTIEGDKLNHLDSRTRLRLEAFLDMMLDMKEAFI